MVVFYETPSTPKNLPPVDTSPPPNPSLATHAALFQSGLIVLGLASLWLVLHLLGKVFGRHRDLVRATALLTLRWLRARWGRFACILAAAGMFGAAFVLDGLQEIVAAVIGSALILCAAILSIRLAPQRN